MYDHIDAPEYFCLYTLGVEFQGKKHSLFFFNTFKTRWIITTQGSLTEVRKMGSHSCKNFSNPQPYY